MTDLLTTWINAVTKDNNPEKVANLFCNDGFLWGTVAQNQRTGYAAIKGYFDYFAKLPEIKVINRNDNIRKISNNVYQNNATLVWQWKGLNKPITARMTFLYNKNSNGDWCISSLHSSALPDQNQGLKDASNKF